MLTKKLKKDILNNKKELKWSKGNLIFRNNILAIIHAEVDSDGKAFGYYIAYGSQHTNVHADDRYYITIYDMDGTKKSFRKFQKYIRNFILTQIENAVV